MLTVVFFFFIVQTLSFMHCTCNFICGLSDVIIKTFSQSVSQCVSVTTVCIFLSVRLFNRPAGTGLCSYRVRGVGGSCAEHLAMEFYTVVMLLTSILIIISIQLPPHSFISGLS